MLLLSSASAIKSAPELFQFQLNFVVSLQSIIVDEGTRDLKDERTF